MASLTPIWIIAGPTASGKSRLALEIAEKMNGEILNADSIQVYKDLCVLSARPSFEDEQRVPHHGYGFLEPTENFSAGIWLQWITEKIHLLQSQSKNIFIVGGTGLYLKALLEGLFEIPFVDPRIRMRLEKRVQQETIDVLYQELLVQDAVTAQKISPQDTQRILRGLEIFEGTGKPLSFWRSHQIKKPNLNLKVMLLLPERAVVQERAEKRVLQMVDQGALDEIKGLWNQGVPITAPIFRGLGAKEIHAYLQNQLTLKDVISLTQIKTHQYIKRQYTWFRHQLKPDIILHEIENQALNQEALQKIFLSSI